MIASLLASLQTVPVPHPSHHTLYVHFAQTTVLVRICHTLFLCCTFFAVQMARRHIWSAHSHVLRRGEHRRRCRHGVGFICRRWMGVRLLGVSCCADSVRALLSSCAAHGNECGTGMFSVETECLGQPSTLKATSAHSCCARTHMQCHSNASLRCDCTLRQSCSIDLHATCPGPALQGRR